MSNPNVLVSDLQSLEIPSALVSLYELQYSSSVTFYFHPGLDHTVRVTNIAGSTLTLNSSQDFTVGVTLTFTGVNTSGSTVTFNKTVTGGNPSTNTVILNSVSDLFVGMEVTGVGVKNIDYSPIVFDGNTYYALPVEMTDFEVNTEGVQNRPELRIANVESVLRNSSIFQNANDGGTDGIANFTLDDLIGKRITKRQTLEKYLIIDPSTISTKAVVEYPKRTYIIDRVKQRNAELVVFELANPFDLEGVTLPARQVIGKYCPWIYQGHNLDTPTGGCTWQAGGKRRVEFNVVGSSTSTTKTYINFFTAEDEPIIWKYLIHDSSAPSNILSGKTHPGNTSSYYSKNDLVALSDGASGYTYWQSTVSSNNTVPSASNTKWRVIRLYEPWVSGTTYSVNSTDSKRNEYVVHSVTNASTRNDTSFDFGDNATVFRVVITNSTVTPSSKSNYWTGGDLCGKLLSSCSARYQFKTVPGAGTLQNTIPNVDTTAAQPLYFGGFPGSRKFR